MRCFHRAKKTEHYAEVRSCEYAWSVAPKIWQAAPAIKKCFNCIYFEFHCQYRFQSRGREILLFTARYLHRNLLQFPKYVDHPMISAPSPHDMIGRVRNYCSTANSCFG